MVTHGSCRYNTQMSIGFSFGLIAHPSLRPATFQPMHSNKQADLERNAEHLLLSPLINVIFSIGPLATYTLHKISNRLSIKKLVLFAGVTNPIELGIIKSYTEPSNFCGILDEFTLHDRFNAFFNLFPDAKNVVLLYDPSQTHIVFEKDNIRVRNFLTEKGLNVIDMPISLRTSIQNGLEATLESLQSVSTKTVIVAMPDTYIMSSVESIARSAQKYAIPLYSFDTEAAKEGIVSCASGIDSNQLGAYVSDRIMPLLHEGPAKVGLSEKYTLPPITIVSTLLLPQLSAAAQEWCMKHADLIAVPFQ